MSALFSSGVRHTWASCDFSDKVSALFSSGVRHTWASCDFSDKVYVCMYLYTVIHSHTHACTCIEVWNSSVHGLTWHSSTNFMYLRILYMYIRTFVFGHAYIRTYVPAHTCTHTYIFFGRSSITVIFRHFIAKSMQVGMYLYVRVYFQTHTLTYAYAFTLSHVLTHTHLLRTCLCCWTTLAFPTRCMYVCM